MKLINPSKLRHDLGGVRRRLREIGDGSIALTAARMVAGTDTASATDAIAYGSALRRQKFQSEMNFRHLKAGLPQLVEPWIELPARGHTLYTKINQAVTVDIVSRGQPLNDDQAHYETMSRLVAMKKRSSKPATGSRQTMPIRLTQVKLLGNGRRIRGFATTPDVDRVGDIIEPAGMVARLPVPLLYGHDHSKTIGTVVSADIRRDGVYIEADIVDGIALADEALKLIDARAIDAFSIGFRGLKAEPLPSGGLRYTSWELLEISIVAVPANSSARIDRRDAIRLVK